MPANLYYEYIIPRANSVLLTRHEWARGLGLKDKDVKKAQKTRHREVAEGLAEKVSVNDVVDNWHVNT
jgi:hypothetical protein